MKRNVILLLMLTCCLSFVFANRSARNARTQTGYKIDIDAPQLRNQTVYLGMYFSGRLFARDTALLDNRGRGSFQKNTPLHEGMYAIYFLNNTRVIDILISDEQRFRVQIDTTDLVNNVFITGAEQSKAFQNYVKFISSQRAEVERISQQFEAALTGEDSIQAQEERQEKIAAIDRAVRAYQENIVQMYGNKTLGVIMRALMPVEIPEVTAENDSIRQQKEYLLNRKHFFDNINLSDPRLLHTAFLPQKIDFFMQRMVPQIPDTITTEAVRLIEKSKGDTLTFRNMLTNMLNLAVRSNMMGMDRLTLTLARDYFLAGKAPWADSTLLANLEREVRRVQHNQIGALAPNLRAETLDGRMINLHDLPQDYILLYFFEPSCGHCRREMPRLYQELYQKFRENNFLGVFAFYSHIDRDEWTNFIDEHGMHSWTNVWDPRRTSNFWYFYDATVTPSLYLLNRERKIIAKKISLETLDMILEAEKRRNQQ